MIKTEVERLWLLALLSKCESLTLQNTIIMASIFLLSGLILHLTFWAHPGGPAWGKHKWTLNHKTSPPIPGPRGLPLIGSMGLMSGLAHRHIAAAALAHKARRLMSFSLGQTRVIVTCDPEVAKDILNSPAFCDRPAKESAYRLMFNRSIGFAPYGAYWAALRRISAAHLFCPRQIRASEQKRAEIASELVGVLAGSAAGIRVRDVLKLASLNNMMWSVFGRSYGLGSVDPETEELRDLVDEGYDLLGKLNWSDHIHIPFVADLDLQRIRLRCGRIVPRVKRFVGRIIAEHKVEKCSSSSGDFVDVLLSLKGADRLSDSDMISVLWEMIFRGTDTVAVVIEWILARLVLHPDVQLKVHGELDQVVGRSGAVTESHLTELVYLTAVVKEVLRMHPPGPLLSWSRLSITDSIVDGHHVPSATTAVVNMWAIMRDPNVWTDPLTFNPDRFLAQTTPIADQFSLLGSDLRIAPFGSGRRSCPAKTLAITTVTFWVATLLHEFQFMGDVDLSEVLKLSCEMANPLVVRVRPRRAGV
ncbi:Cytochrome P450 78A9 [Striga hermonthica]|uniref:Cytochrome P450 78A9 n=1 Tax=Striga hermonthica TaxID=68872 RepID=A0A9N7MVN4_STRHE|nr:Cytochrome P450 78A9 [Striga hermonthica]